MSKANRRAAKKLAKQQARYRELEREAAWRELSPEERQRTVAEYRAWLERVIPPKVIRDAVFHDTTEDYS